MKKIKTFILIAMISVLSLPLVSYARGSHTDMNFQFKMGKLDFNQYTSARRKYETSPVYCKVNYFWSTGQSAKLSAVRGDHSKSTFTPVTYVTKPDIYYLSSNIYEDFRSRGTNSSARIRCQKYNRFQKLTVKGVWSPDSY